MSATLNNTVAALMALHTNNINIDMVYEVWNDGEITLTKGHDLYGQRILHCVVPSLPSGLPINCGIPLRYNNSRIIVPDYETACKARELIEAFIGA